MIDPIYLIVSQYESVHTILLCGDLEVETSCGCTLTLADCRCYDEELDGDLPRCLTCVARQEEHRCAS